MIDFYFLVPIALGMGLAGLAAFMWCLRSGQYDDLDGAAVRILLEADEGPDPRAADEQSLSGSVTRRAVPY
ncbi:MAG TPA: cbb3-type cytochrome oxidase assembly protein CcoS [Bradyrhizobium sp.]|nr:cbb3-type cytochrome oxidase assembly protein CcoS [Bradyrhizobium sp.]